MKILRFGFGVVLLLFLATPGFSQGSDLERKLDAFAHRIQTALYNRGWEPVRSTA